MIRFLKYFLGGLVATFLWPTITNADPVTISAAIAATVAAIEASITTAAIIQAIVLTAVSVGLQYIERALTNKPPTIQGVNTQLQFGGIIPRSFILGFYASAGSLTYTNSWGTIGKTPNAYLVQVIALSDMPILQLSSMFVDNVGHTLPDMSGSPPVEQGWPVASYNSVGGDDYMWLKFYDGTQTVADPYLVDKFSGDANFPYPDTMVGYGIAYIIITTRLSPGFFPSGVPKFRFGLGGIPLYDPRQDSTVGGSGTERFDDQSTWGTGIVNNPMLMEYNILRGITYDGTWMFGTQGLSANRVPYEPWRAAIAECGRLVDNHDGGTEQQFRAGAEIQVNLQAVDIIDELNKSCNGRLAEVGGIYKPAVGAASSPVGYIIDEDIIVTEQQSLTQFPTQSSVINGITANHPDAASSWTPTDIPPIYNATLEAADGGKRLETNVTYAFVPYLEQCERLMYAAIAEARKFRSHLVSLPQLCWLYEPNDVVGFTSARAQYDNKLFRVVQITDNDNLNVLAQITECDPADYDYDPDTMFIEHSDGPLVLAASTSQGMSGWDATNTTVTSDTGRILPAIVMSWDVDVDDVIGVQYQVKLISSGDIILNGTTRDWEDGLTTVSHNIQGDTAYQVRGRYIPSGPNRDTDWSSWVDVTTDLGSTYASASNTFGHVESHTVSAVGSYTLNAADTIFVAQYQGVKFFASCTLEELSGSDYDVQLSFQNPGIAPSLGSWPEAGLSNTVHLAANGFGSLAISAIFYSTSSIGDSVTPGLVISRPGGNLDVDVHSACIYAETIIP